jgi:hypothetical protein
VDSVFCGANVAVSGLQPAGIAYGAQSIASTGATAIAADVRSMVATMVGGGVSLRAGGTWILSAEAYSLLCVLKIVDTNGTTLAGLPIVSNAPAGSLLLIAVDYVSHARADDVRLAASKAGTIEMDDTPTGDAVTPAAATSHIVNLFQEDALALRAVLDINWSVAGPSDSNGNFAVVALTGSTFA